MVKYKVNENSLASDQKRSASQVNWLLIAFLKLYDPLIVSFAFTLELIARVVAINCTFIEINVKNSKLKSFLSSIEFQDN